MRAALWILLAVAAPAFAGTVWKWVDEKGVTHYSDRPVPGATKVEVAVGSRWDSTVPQSSPTPDTSRSPAEPGESQYRELEIWKPAQGEVIANTGGQVAVEIRLNPPLQPTHVLSLYLDGKLVEGFPENTTSYALKDVARGLHSVLATIIDSRGQRVTQSAAITFTVRQESIAQPPVGPALRPPPKPSPRGAANKLPARQPTYEALQGPRPAIDPTTNAPALTQGTQQKKSKSGK